MLKLPNIPKAIVVLDDGQDFHMYSMTGALFFAAVITLLLFLFKAASIGHFGSVSWWVVSIPFAIIGFFMFLASIRR